MCNGCFGIFVAGACVQPPKNELGLKVVCSSCYKQYFGGSSPMPTNTTHLADRYGVYLTPKTAGILSNANAGVVPTNAGNMVNAGGLNLIGNDSGGLVNAGGLNVVPTNAGNMVNAGGLNLVDPWRRG